MKQENNNAAFYIKNILIGTFLSVLIATALFITFSLTLAKSKALPINVVNQLPFILVLISAFFSSFFTAKLAKSKGMFLGIATGFSFFVLLFVLNYLISHEINLKILLIRGASILLISSIGGIIGVNKNKKRRKI